MLFLLKLAQNLQAKLKNGFVMVLALLMLKKHLYDFK